MRQIQQGKRLVIAIEGIDGAGKTTLTNAIRSRFGKDASILPRTKKGKRCEALISSRLVRDNHFIQIPIYLFLSYINYFKNKNKTRTPILIMDRCFLSNICYYYPAAMKNKILLWLALLFEIKITPNLIFIIDEEPCVAHQRDGYKKQLSWLIAVRMNYLESAKSEPLEKYGVVVIPKEFSIEDKVNAICDAIILRRRHNNDS